MSNRLRDLFEKDENGLYLSKNAKGVDWVIYGEGEATLKVDGLWCRLKDGVIYKHKMIEDGRRMEVPLGPLKAGRFNCRMSESDVLYWEAFTGVEPEGEYELCGPGVKGNPECFPMLVLVPLGGLVLKDVPVNYYGLKDWFKGRNVEGVVWHHPDGRMVKADKAGFGMPRIDWETDGNG